MARRFFDTAPASPPPTGVGSMLSEIDMMGTPLLNRRSSLEALNEENTPTPTNSCSKRKHADEADMDAEPAVPMSASKRAATDVFRDRSNTLSFAQWLGVTGRTETPKKGSLQRSASTRSLISRMSRPGSTKKKTVRGYFGSPRNRHSSTSSLWTETLGDDKESVLKSISAKELKRREAVHEIVSTEGQYLEDIRNLVKLFSDPMRKMNIISDDVQRALFANINDIIAFHSKLQRDMIASGTDFDGNIGPALQENAAGFRVYGQYCANMAYAKHVLERQKATDARFTEFMELCRDLPQTRRMDLWDLMDYPRRRLQRYPLLSKVILGHTMPETAEHAQMAAAIAEIESSIAFVDAFVADNSRASLVELQSSLDFTSAHCDPIDLVEDNQPLMGVVDVRLKAVGKDVRLYLFAHVLLIVKEKKRDNELRRVVVTEPLKLAHLSLEDPRDLPDTQLKVRYVDPGHRRASLRGIQRASSMSSKSHILEFTSNTQRTEWISLITSARQTAIQARQATLQAQQAALQAQATQAQHQSMV
eukprot:m.20289 g.20289  ORF g.20289 m.20289 type:complete len:534 (+) comp3518_c0_seq2:84-1685(+)